MASVWTQETATVLSGHVAASGWHRTQGNVQQQLQPDPIAADSPRLQHVPPAHCMGYRTQPIWYLGPKTLA